MTAIALIQNVKNLPPVSQAALSFGLSEPVSSVDQAVFILGYEQILHTVITLAFGSVMTTPSPAYTAGANELWQHSLIAATATETVLNHLPGLNAQPNAAFTAALLHDIGKLVFAQTLSTQQLAEIRDRADRKLISFTDAEREVLGTDHGETGAALLQSWRLPESIVEAVANHHRPALKPEARLSVLVHIVNAVAHHAEPVPEQNSHDLKIADAVSREYGIDSGKLETMVEEARLSFKSVDRFMAMS